jgi:hypothetical protein
MALLSPRLDWSQAQTKWAATLNPIVSNPLVSGLILSDIKVTTGANTINHLLGRDLQGYIVILNSAAITYYDSQATNQRPQLTLILNASGDATISLYVF